MAPTIEQRRDTLRGRFTTWTPRTLGEWLEHCATEYADRPFVITDDRTYSYAEVNAWADVLADGLAARGVVTGERVGLLMANYPEFVPLKFAIAKAGAVAIPFNYLYRRDELAYVLAQSRCNVLVTMSGFGTLDYLSMLDDIAPGWESALHTTLPDLRDVFVLCTDGRVRDGSKSLADLARLGEEHVGAARKADARPDDVGDMLYTSGTTGSPKGVLVTHDAVQRTAYASALTRAFQDGRRVLFSLPCYHMFGYVEGLLAVMTVGGAIVPHTSFDPAAYLAAIDRHQVDDVLAVPTMAVALLEQRTRPRRPPTAMLCGSAPAPVSLWEQVRAQLGIEEIVTGYGMTECGGAMTLTLPEDPLERTSSTVGRPKLAGVAGLPGGRLVEYKAIDPETGADLPQGTAGELASRGPTTMLGFYDKPDETAAVLRDGWLRSGDLGLVGEDGYLRLTGRSKELYKSGGELVMPKEIEELLTAHPAISQAYAVGLPDERWGEIGCAVVVLVPGAVLDADEVLQLCRDNLARFKVPKLVRFLTADQLPTTPTGKVQKYRLVDLITQELEVRTS